jgi:carbamoyltransferase
MLRVLGISAFYHDSAAALVCDGKVEKAAQEERFTRKKHDASFPANAIHSCLGSLNNTDNAHTLKLEELDAIVFYDKPLLKFERLLETYLATAPKGFISFAKAMPIWLKEKLYLKSVLRSECRKIIHQQRAEQNGSTLFEERDKEKRPKLPKLLFCEHHESHAAAAYLPSPYTKAAILCLDGVGEWATSSAWVGEGAELHPLFEIQFPHSLGLLYSAFTQYCGFKVNSGEYKLMGLAPYGQPIYADKIKQHLVNIRQDGSFSLNMVYFDYAAGKTMTNKRFHDLFGGKPYPTDAGVEQKQMDLASSIQLVTEEIVLTMARFLHKETGCDALCLAGGVALNCVANGRLLREGPFKDIWIQPAAGDAGSAVGAALHVSGKYFDNERIIASSQSKDAMNGAYLGDEFTNDQVEELCKTLNLPYQMLSNDSLYTSTASAICKEMVVGWFQGAMEFGPRALGNRSIVGDPRSSAMQSQMNLKIKQRESFRPFAPAVLAEDVNQWFELDIASPYMLLVAQLKPAHLTELPSGQSLFGLDKLNQIRSSVPAITHVDNSARVQTVDSDTNPSFHKLISAFKSKTGVGMLINTSFNVRGEPPVRSPADAIRCFLATDMDMLVMQNIVLCKDEVQQSACGREQIRLAKLIEFEKD